jgi:hypothetical protein
MEYLPPPSTCLCSSLKDLDCPAGSSSSFRNASGGGGGRSKMVQVIFLNSCNRLDANILNGMILKEQRSVTTAKYRRDHKPFNDATPRNIIKYFKKRFN